MADKSGRRKDQEIRLSEAQMRHPGMEHVIRTRDNVTSSSETTGLADEYGYVVSELRRIAVIAVVMLGVLVGLALFVV
jgi:uncharacterized membrane protein (UPF0182 family)